MSTRSDQCQRGAFEDQAHKIAIQDWCWGFYLNAALQRIVWVGERSLSVFGYLTAACCNDAPTPANRKANFVKRLERARARVEHCHFEAYTSIRQSVKLMSVEYEGSVEVDDSNYFAALRWDVNEAKHSVGVPRRGGSTVTSVWEELSADLRVEYVVSGLNECTALYADLHRAYFIDKVLKPPPMTSTIPERTAG